MSFQQSTSKAAVICVALLLFSTGALATSSHSGPQILAQTAPMESASPEPTAEPATPATQPAPVAPMQTMAPAAAPQPAAQPQPVTPATTLPNGTMNNSGAPEIMHGGITGNSNGSNWLDKFNRTPFPEGLQRGVSPTTRVKAAKYVKPTHKRVRVKPY